MPVNFETLPIEQVMSHQAAYDLVAQRGPEIYRDWSLIDFEKEAISFGGGKYTRDEERFNRLMSCLAELNQSMPFLRLGEKGSHHGYELFLSQPCGWCSRGAPLYWAYASRAFTYDALPMAPESLTAKYLGIAESFGIPVSGDEYVHVARFASGGMSSGMVGGTFIEESLKVLLGRNELYFMNNLIILDDIEHEDVNPVDWNECEAGESDLQSALSEAKRLLAARGICLDSVTLSLHKPVLPKGCDWIVSAKGIPWVGGTFRWHSSMLDDPDEGNDGAAYALYKAMLARHEEEHGRSGTYDKQ